MRLRELIKYNIPQSIIDAWNTRQGDYLLPLQENAIRAGLLGMGKNSDICPNILISAPTSSGKSFCGEMAAVAELLRRKKAVMLVPLKSIAEEKREHFSSCYQSLGIRTLIVTRDHPENDISFQLGDFDLAIAIYEKFNRALTANIDILGRIGLVIVDELQMLGDRDRGPELEMALTKIKSSRYSPRIIALSAVIDDGAEAAQWLNCRIIRQATRPIDLLQGVVSGGYYHFRSFNSGVEGKEKFEIEDSRDEVSEAVIEFLKKDNSRKLVFLKSRRDTIEAAFKLAASVNWGEARGALLRLDDDEPSFLSRALRQTLSRGIAFHNADLTPSQRRGIEQGYLKGEILVIFSTTTLAMGVNLPAEMVLMETMKYGDGNSDGKPSLIPITPAEFRNIAGRAGRFGLGSSEAPGKAIILAGSDFERDVLWSNYIETYSENQIDSQLERIDYADLILDIIVCGLARTPDEIRRVLEKTFHYLRYGSYDDSTIARSVANLAENGLIAKNNSATPVGEALAEAGISVVSYRYYREALKKASPQSLLGWLFVALGAREFPPSRSGLTSQEYKNHCYERLLFQRFGERIGEIAPHIDIQLGLEPLDFRHCAVLKAAFILSDWADEIPVEQIEQRYQLHHGQIINLGKIAAWLLISLGRIIKAADHRSPMASSLEDFAFMAQYGVSPEVRSIHALAGQRLNRRDYKALRDSGICSIESVKSLTPDALAKIMNSENKAMRILEIINNMEKEENMSRVTTLNANVGRYSETTPNITSGATPSLLELDGGYVGDRYLIRLDGLPIRLTGKSFKYLVKLACARLINGEGWIYKDDIEIGFNQARYLYRLRQEMASGGNRDWPIFENNRLGYYRLSLEPEKIRLNLDNLKSHPDYELQQAAANLAPRLVS
jgi:helicase